MARIIRNTKAMKNGIQFGHQARSNTTKSRKTQQPITIVVSNKTSKTRSSRIRKRTTVNINFEEFNLNLEWNNYWSSFNYLMIKLRITRPLYSKNPSVNTQKNTN